MWAFSEHREGCSKQLAEVNCHRFKFARQPLRRLTPPAPLAQWSQDWCETQRHLFVTEFDVNRLFTCKPAVCIGVQWTPLRFNFIITVYDRQGNFLKYYSATDSGKLQIARRGDHWSPFFKLLKLFFRYKSATSTNRKTGSLCWLQIGILNRTSGKALFGKESCQRSWLRDWKTFCLYAIFGWKSSYRTKVNPSGFLAKTTSLYMSCPMGTREAKSRILKYIYL